MNSREKILVINSAQPENMQFTKPINRILHSEGYETTIAHWSSFRDKVKMDPYSCIFISASPKGNNTNFQERLRAFQWLREYLKPVMGICAGHQLTGVLFGGELMKNSGSEEGKLEVVLSRDHPLFEGIPSPLQVEQHHLDSVSLPDDFILLASSETCRVQAMIHRTRPLFSVQWHAELSGPELMKNFLKIYRTDE